MMKKLSTRGRLFKNVIKLKIYAIIFLVITLGYAKAQRTITVAGANWNVNPGQITEAGENYVGTYESAANQILLTVRIPLGLASGKVSVRYEANPNWHSAFNLSIRRTGNGSTVCLLCTINGGVNYQPITTINTDLFNIQAVVSLAAYNNIPIQLRLSGVSVTVPAANYQSRIIFTVGPT